MQRSGGRGRGGGRGGWRGGSNNGGGAAPPGRSVGPQGGTGMVCTPLHCTLAVRRARPECFYFGQVLMWTPMPALLVWRC